MIWPIQAEAKDIFESARATPPIVFSNPSYDFEFRRTLGRAVAGGADLNECLAAARRIKQGDGLSWYTQWHALAQRVDAQGEKDLAAGHNVSAMEAWFKASNYYRAAPFFLHGDPKDSRIRSSWRKSRDVFRKAAVLLPYPAEVVAIPYENTTLPGYFIRPDASGRTRKTLIAQTGFDGTGEEMFYAIGLFALKRGYNLLIFEGPGQGGALREQGLHFRPDWEKVVTPVVDFALARREVDPGRLAMIGHSMGGHLVPRAAAFEHRLAAIVANPGVLALAGKGFPDAKTMAWMEKNPQEANQGIQASMAKDTGLRWFINNGMYTCGKKTPLDFMLFWQKFNLKGLAGHITCPTLVIVSEQDIFLSVKDQKALYEELKCPKTLLAFTGDRDAGYHCQMGAGSVRGSSILNWLDDTLSRIR
ncbi:MAG: alpha/beta fold hydrolase [Proteobacteria bacterium]|nr:alpha/beta fold hydrolase [Pseudomonadota bacterium]